ncbi:MAG TPA: ABC transporter ATP-binding protein [Thermodesulfobacteriota bacterium]|nr:ABC transporter ATP-binding protein [Thermodesulfobacteriota bacterium]
MGLIESDEEKRGKKTYDLRIVRWLFGFALPYRRFMVLSLLFMILTAGLELLVPYITKTAVDRYISPSWRKARFSGMGKDKGLENRLREKYPSSLVTLGEGTYLIDLSSVDREDKTNLEKLGYVSRDRYLVINLKGIKEEELEGVREILKNHREVFHSVGEMYFADYSSLKKLDNRELSVLRSQDIRQVNRLALLLFLSLFLVFIFSSLYTYFLNYSGQRIMHEIRTSVFSHILTLPQAFFDKNPVGRLTTRVTNDVNAINEVYTSVLVQFFKDVIVIFGVLIVMFYMNRVLTLFILVLTVILGVVAALFRMRLKTVYRNVRKTIAKLNSFVQESIRGIVLIKLYMREKQNLERFKVVNRENYNANMDQLFAFATFRPIIEFISVFAVALILWYGGLSVLRLELSLGALLAYLSYIKMLFGPIVELAERYNVFQSASAASENLYDLMKLDPEEKEGKRAESVSGELEFRNVWFSYNGEDWILKDVSFTVRPGETVALVGLTGSGKTTVVNLILKFYEIQRGKILFDGVDIREWSTEFLRANISAVFQDLFLFGNTISDGNLRSPTDPGVEEGNGEAKGALEGLWGSIGIHGLMASSGGSVSSGEKQLVSLGRAFSRDARVLILDEATSHIDAETELKIQEAVKRGSKRRTTLIIAHRLSNVRDADRIIVIHKGEIFEQGIHAELLERGGIYYNLYKLQNEIHRFSSLGE